MVLFCALATPALAQENWYVGLKGGLNVGPDADIEGLPVSLSTNMGAVALLNVGYTQGRWRLENEVSWRRNETDELKGPGGSVSVDGELTNIAYMVNGIYTFPGGSFRPFVLGGLGVSRVEGEITGIDGYDVQVDDNETVFAYQAGLGVEVPMTEKLRAEVSYRFFGTSTVEFDGVDVNNYNHTGLFGLTYAF